MPLDKAGKYHMNPAHARQSAGILKGRMPKGGTPQAGMSADHAPQDENNTGTEAQEPAHADIQSHLQQMHEKHGGAHSHVMHDGMGGHTLHHISEDGEVSGPHDVQNLHELKGAMGKFLGEEEHEDGY